MPFHVGFKPSTNYKAIQLLKTYVCYDEMTQSGYVSSIPTGDIRYILLNASWTLPWLWGQRDIDEEFVMAVVSTKHFLESLEPEGANSSQQTVAWIMDSCKDVNAESTELPDQHPVQAFIKQNKGSLVNILTACSLDTK